MVKIAKVKRHPAGAEFVVSRRGGNGLLYETVGDDGGSPL